MGKRKEAVTTETKPAKRYCDYLQDENPQKRQPGSTRRYRNRKKEILSKIQSQASNSNERMKSEGSIDPGSCEFGDGGLHTAKEEVAEDTQDSNDTNSPIYDGCAISLEESAFLILQYAILHKVAGSALVDLLALVKAHLPKNIEFFTYVNQLRNVFGKSTDIPLVVNNYCNSCYTQVNNNVCATCGMNNPETTQLIRLPIAHQIQSFFNDEEFRNLIVHRKQKEFEGVIEDVYDGEVYRSVENSILKSEFNISLKVNTDGVAVFKSSSVHMWPTYFQINELSPEKRTLSKYRLLAGLWFGKKKPDMNIMLAPIVDELQMLEQDGCTIMLPDGELVNSKVIVLTGHFDTPAKDAFLNKIHHNGKYGCSFCEDEGKTTKSGKGHCHAYPYLKDSIGGFGRRRTVDRWKENATDAVQQRKPVMGIKGACAFSKLKYFDPVHSISIDYMHTVCLGVVKKLLSTWFKPENKNGPCYIGNRIKDVDKRLTSICPPNNVTRTPRSIEDHLKHYKASELKTWLLHYGPVCLKDVLPQRFYDHFLYLSKGIYLLLSTKISEEDLEESQLCLQSFCLLTKQLYGDRFMTINFHLVLHATDSVRKLGPLWTSSCFSFEDYNGQLTDFFHGTQHVEKQILNAVIFQQKLPQMKKVLKNKTTCKLLDNLVSKNRITLKESVGADMFVVGATHKILLLKMLPEHQLALQTLLPVARKTMIKTFNRISIKGTIFHSASYSRVKKRNSFTVKYETDDGDKYGRILNFCCVETEVCAFLQPFEVLNSVSNEHIALHVKCVELLDIVVAVPIMKIISKCVSMKIDQQRYISELPNVYECD